MNEQTSIPPEASTMIAGALFDFLGFLTTRDESTSFGAAELATPAVDLLDAWAKERGLPLEPAAVGGWRELARALQPELRALTEADSLADLAGTPRPDHPTAA